MVHLYYDIIFVNFLIKTAVALTFESRLFRTSLGTILTLNIRCDVPLVTSIVNTEAAVAYSQDLQLGLCMTGQMFFSQHPPSHLHLLGYLLSLKHFILSLVHFLLPLFPSPPSLFHHPHLSNSHFNPSIPLRSTTSSPEGPVKQTVTHSGDLDNK